MNRKSEKMKSCSSRPKKHVDNLAGNESVPQFGFYMDPVAGGPSAAEVNDMGPPLSRALLLQHPPAQGSFSRPGSVRSCGSTAGASDVVAHVDTDDCGGSLVESCTDDTHSILSQEEEAGPKDESHPLLQNGDAVSNGRTSPGGTVYKGRGVRRYQGRAHGICRSSAFIKMG